MITHAKIPLWSAVLLLLGFGPAHANWSSPVCPRPGNQRMGDVASDGAGGIFVAFEDVSSTDWNVFAQHLTASGTVATGWAIDGVPVGFGPSLDKGEVILSDGAGGAFVAWDSGNPPNIDVFLQHLRADGTSDPAWPAGGLRVCGESGEQSRARLASDGAGGAFVAWVDQRTGSGNNDIYLHHVLADGSSSPGWPSGGLPVCTAANGQDDVRLAPDGEGGVVIAWDDFRNGNTLAAITIFASRIRGDGTAAVGWSPNGNAVCPGTGRALQPRLAGDGAGGAFISWIDERGGVPAQIYAQHLSANGNEASGWPHGGLHLAPGRDQQLEHAIVADGPGSFFSVWEDSRSWNHYEIYAQRVTADGHVAPGWDPLGVLVSTRSVYQRYPDLALDGRGGVFVTWTEQGSSYEAVALQRLNANGAIAPGWNPLGRVVAGGSLSRLVPSGSEEVVLASGDGADLAATEISDHTGLTDRPSSPSSSSFALDAIVPNPARGPIAVGFTLPDGLPATLDVLDVAGRRVESREVGHLGEGTHRTTIFSRAAPAVGVYLVRLSGSGRIATARVAWVR